MTNRCKASVRRFLICLSVAAVSTATSVPPTYAGMIGTPTPADVKGTERADDVRVRLDALLDRDQVIEALQAQGVSPQIARERLAALTDDEVLQLQHDIEQAPAGAGLLGATVFVFLVLLATDILGFTKVFPFTRPAR